jgi:bacterioferritin-associated ferredoxin
MRVLRLSLNPKERNQVIVCICRGTSDRKILAAIDNGASSLRDLQRCGIGDQCGSCHNSLRAMLTAAEAERAAAQPCPACAPSEVAVLAAMA